MRALLGALAFWELLDGYRHVYRETHQSNPEQHAVRALAAAYPINPSNDYNISLATSSVKASTVSRICASEWVELMKNRNRAAL